MPTPTLSRLLLVSLLAGAAACGVKTTYVKTNPSPRPMAARSPESVQFFSTSLPDRPYVEVGLFEAQGRNEQIDMADLIEELRSEAAQVGCDGVILTGTRNKVAGNEYGVATHKGYAATCILFSGDAPATASAPAPATGAPAAGAPATDSGVAPAQAGQVGTTAPSASP